MRSGRLAVSAVFAAGLLSAPPPAAAQAYARLVAVRAWAHGDLVRVAIETNDQVEYHAEYVESPPDRVFVDLQDTRRTPGIRGVQTEPGAGSLLRQIRIAETQPGVTRVVFDLTARAEYSISQLPNPDRLIVELRPSGAGSQPASLPAPTPPAKVEVPAAPPVIAAVKTEPVATGPAVPVAADIRRAESPPPAGGLSHIRRAESPGPEGAPPEHHTAAAPAKPDRQGERSLIRALGLKLERVVIDPGHGGHDTGTIGPAGYMEKDLVLDVARRLAPLITAKLGSEVLLTREDDTFIALRDRTAFAVEHKADLFLSLHANSSRARSVSGPETFYLNFTTDQAALEVAARENALADRTVSDFPELIQKIALYEKVHESHELAETVQRALYTALWRRRGVRDRGVKKAPFVVLIGAQIPSVLTEIGFLSNPREEAQLRKPVFRQRIAEALLRAVDQYAGNLSRFQLAQKKTAGAAPPVSTPSR